MHALCLTAVIVSHLEVLDVDALPAGHGKEATEVGIVEKDVNRHSPQRGGDDLFENVDVGEDVHRYGNNLEAQQTCANTLSEEKIFIQT